MRLRGALALAFCFAWAVGAGAQTSQNTRSNPLFSSRTLLGKGNGQMLLRADHVDYDMNTSVTTAEGHVEIDYNGRILLADRIIYDKNRDSVTAAGHVVMMAPNGDVVFAQQARLTDRMKDSALESFAASLEASELRDLLQALSSSVKNGSDVTLLETDAELTPSQAAARSI